MSDIEDLVKDQEEDETKAQVHNQKGGEIDYLMDNQDKKEAAGEDSSQEKVLVGKVAKFFSKISVAAIVLVADLKVGDRIQIEDEDGGATFVVSSMQINNENVSEASEGDDIGIKVDRPVKEGSKVYRIV